MDKEAMGRLILEASTGMHGDVAKQLSDAWAGMASEVQRLQALSVTNILLAIVPGDGSGEEVYAQSVEDIYKELADLSERAEEARAQAVAVRAKLNEVHSWIVCAAIASPDDMMQSAARIEEITRPE